MKKYIYLLLVLLVLAYVASIAAAEEKKVLTQYEVTVEMRFNSVTFERAQEIERIIKEIAAESCKTEVRKEKLPKDDVTGVITGSTIQGGWVINSN